MVTLYSELVKFILALQLSFSASQQNHLVHMLHEFYELFPNKGDFETNLLKTTLLYYGEYWNQKSPWYYTNYYFGDWKRIIRSINCKDRFNFKRFFEDYKTQTLIDLNKSLKVGFVNDYKEKYIDELLIYSGVLPATDFRSMLIIYSMLTNIWLYGDCIVVYSPEQPFDKPRLFGNEKNEIYNTKGSFRGNSGYCQLWEKVNYNYEKQVKELFHL